MTGAIHRDRLAHQEAKSRVRSSCLNGGPADQFNEAVSFFIACETQGEVGYDWKELAAFGGRAGKCNWLRDKFGVSWQAVPTALGRCLGDPDRAKADRCMQAMLKMSKLVIAERDEAAAG